jgi:hypothetical protein
MSVDREFSFFTEEATYLEIEGISREMPQNWIAPEMRHLQFLLAYFSAIKYFHLA